VDTAAATAAAAGDGAAGRRRTHQSVSPSSAQQHRGPWEEGARGVGSEPLHTPRAGHKAAGPREGVGTDWMGP